MPQTHAFAIGSVIRGGQTEPEPDFPDHACEPLCKDCRSIMATSKEVGKLVNGFIKINPATQTGA